jgi:methionyl-tRNA formyltransferase
VVAAYGKILTDRLLAIPRLGMINVHGSLLPRYRGAAPVHRAIIDGETTTGITIMRVVKALDAGPMLAKERRFIGPEETSEELERDLAAIGARLLVTVLDQIARGAAHETPQDESLVTYAHRLTKDDGVIDWHWPAARIHNLIRGLFPWPHAFSFLGGKRFILLRSLVLARGDGNPDPVLTESDRAVSTIEPGTILESSSDRLIIATGDGRLRVTEIQAEGKRPVNAREFLAGHRLTPGDRFTPAP